MNIAQLKSFVVNKIKTEKPADLYYHGLRHTLEVLESCDQYIQRMNINEEDAYLLRTAALMHDLGILWSYSNHEEHGVAFIRKELPKRGYSEEQIETITQLVLATQIPQKPKTVLQNIICDADLDYLGTDDFYSTGNLLYKELMAKNVVSNEKEWDKLQVNFLRSHHYHTDFAKEHREPIKQKYLQEILDKWGWK